MTRNRFSPSKTTSPRASGTGKNRGAPRPPKRSRPPQPASTPRALAPPQVLNAATADTGLTIQPEPYDPVAAEAALAALRPRLAAIPAEQLAVARVDVRASALAALNAHAQVTQAPSLHARFRKLHAAGEIEIGVLDDVRNLAFVVVYAFGQAEAAGAFETDAKVPPATIAAAAAVEGRMRELLEYRFRRDPEVAPLLALLRPGTGHRDLASDLLGYADIYALKHDEVATDGTNYRPTDLADARRLAGEILAHLSAAMAPRAREAYDTLQRAWTLLLRVYFEVREVGTCLLRYDPRRHEKLPSLFAAGRSGRPRRKTEETLPPGPAPDNG